MKRKVDDAVIARLKANFIFHVLDEFSREDLRAIGVSDSKASHIKNPDRRDIPTMEILFNLKKMWPDFDLNLVFEI